MTQMAHIFAAIRSGFSLRKDAKQDRDGIQVLTHAQNKEEYLLMDIYFDERDESFLLTWQLVLRLNLSHPLVVQLLEEVARELNRHQVEMQVAGKRTLVFRAVIGEGDITDFEEDAEDEPEEAAEAFFLLCNNYADTFLSLRAALHTCVRADESTVNQQEVVMSLLPFLSPSMPQTLQ